MQRLLTGNKVNCRKQLFFANYRLAPQKLANPGDHCRVSSVLPNSRTLPKDLPEEPSGHAAGEISPFHQPRDRVAGGDDLFPASMGSARLQSSVQEAHL